MAQRFGGCTPLYECLYNKVEVLEKTYYVSKECFSKCEKERMSWHFLSNPDRNIQSCTFGCTFSQIVKPLNMILEKAFPYVFRLINFMSKVKLQNVDWSSCSNDLTFCEGRI